MKMEDLTATSSLRRSTTQLPLGTGTAAVSSDMHLSSAQGPHPQQALTRVNVENFGVNRSGPSEGVASNTIQPIEAEPGGNSTKTVSGTQQLVKPILL
jgi:hypothetical protein